MAFTVNSIPNVKLSIISKLREYVNSSIKTEALPQSQSFKSISGVNRHISDKAFIVGFVPPDVSINFIPRVDAQGDFLRGKKAIKVVGGGGTPAKSGVLKSALQNVQEQPDVFWDQFIRMAMRLNAKPIDLMIVFFKESQFNPNAMNPLGSARGIFQWIWIDGNKVGTRAQFDNFQNLSAYDQLPYAERFYRNALNIAESQNDKASYKGGQSFLYLATIAPSRFEAWSDTEEGRNFPLYKKPSKAYNDNSDLDADGNGIITRGDLDTIMNRTAMENDKAYFLAEEKIKAAEERYRNGTSDPNPPGSIPSKRPVATITSTGATTFKYVEYTTPDELTAGLYAGPLNNADKEKRDVNNGRNLVDAEESRLEAARLVVQDLSRRIDELSNTPSLLMLVNPRSFNRRFEQSIDYASGRSGPIVSAWLEKPITISCEGSSSVCYALDLNNHGGITGVNKPYSLSYENILSLSLIYRNNGWIMTDYGASSLDATTVRALATSIFIYYDGHIYLGSFDSFKINEGADKPYSYDYSFDFTVRYDIPLDSELSEMSIDNWAYANAFSL